MISNNILYHGVLLHGNCELYRIKKNCFNELVANLACKLEEEFHDAKAQIIRNATGEIAYQLCRSAVC